MMKEFEKFKARNEAKLSLASGRCPICDWPLADSIDAGCVLGNCSFRPREGTAEYYKIKERREALAESDVK